ncbi:hypothetical protein ACLQ28_28755 [Micromonospora sp. DT201]|uniref:hypothetical protein n=1 Tax=Micromonospora sp. DT201 TaxID=3393442 RepID=UPI003CF13BDA
MHTANLTAFLVGGMVAGIGAGLLLKAAISTVAAMTWFTGLLLVMLTGVAALFYRSTATRRAPARHAG